MTETVPASFMSIGEVLAQLRGDFPDVTISKIRFLESEGLVEPERSASGYRRFSRDDLARLRYVLSAQRDHYLPLRVIRGHLDAMDRGLEPVLEPARPRVPATAEGEGLPVPEDFIRSGTEVRLSREELLGESGLDDGQLAQLEQYGLVAPRVDDGLYDVGALELARTVATMARFGIEARHLRSFKTAADREVGLIEQVLAPLLHQRGEARTRADEVARELAALSVRLHAALVRSALAPVLQH